MYMCIYIYIYMHDSKVVTEAVGSHGMALQYASEALRDDDEVVLEAPLVLLVSIVIIIIIVIISIIIISSSSFR